MVSLYDVHETALFSAGDVGRPTYITVSTIAIYIVVDASQARLSWKYVAYYCQYSIQPRRNKRFNIMITVVTFVEYLAVVVGFMLSESMCV